MSLNDLFAAQIEAQFFFYVALGASTTCLCLTMYVCTKMLAEALSRQMVVIEKPVYDATAVYNHWLNRPVWATSVAQSQGLTQNGAVPH